jgi:hypothetical protein
MKRWVVRWEHPNYGIAYRLFDDFAAVTDDVLDLIEKQIHFEVVVIDA